MVFLAFDGGVEFDVGEDLGEKEIGAMIAIENVGVLAEPSKAALDGPFSFEHRTSVDVGAADAARAQCRDRGGDLIGFFQYDVMIVETKRVRSDAPAQFALPI